MFFESFPIGKNHPLHVHRNRSKPVTLEFQLQVPKFTFGDLAWLAWKCFVLRVDVDFIHPFPYKNKNKLVQGFLLSSTGVNPTFCETETGCVAGSENWKNILFWDDDKDDDDGMKERNGLFSRCCSVRVGLSVADG